MVHNWVERLIGYDRVGTRRTGYRPMLVIGEGDRLDRVGEGGCVAREWSRVIGWSWGWEIRGEVDREGKRSEIEWRVQ
jgi:hypothetical protein